MHLPLPASAPPQLSAQLAFIREIDKLKSVLRQTRLIGEARRENSAEHSWHLALMALTLAEYAPEGADINRALQMVLLHDLVEIGAGDTFAFDEAGYEDKAAREEAAADELYGLLGEQGRTLRNLWEEFEAAETADARFANALDRLQPLWMNLAVGGGTYLTHEVALEQVLKRMQPIATGMPTLWPVILEVIETARQRGMIPR